MTRVVRNEVGLNPAGARPPVQDFDGRGGRQ